MIRSPGRPGERYIPLCVYRGRTRLLPCSLHRRCSTLVVGGMVMEARLVLPVVRDLPPDAGVDVHRRLNERAWAYFPPVGAVGTVAAAIAVILRHNFARPGAYLMSAGIVLTLAGVSITM